MDKLVITMISSIMAILMLSLVMANPVLALAVNQMSSSPEYDPEESYTDKECAEMFPIYSEGYYSCTGSMPTPNPGP